MQISKVFSSGGFVLHETSKVVSIVTFNSSNIKTGPMHQIWHLVKALKPQEALKSGLNSLVCGNCPLQGDSKGKNRACYVKLFQGPRAIWQKWNRGGYPQVFELDDIAAIFKGAAVRFGAYGNPSILPVEVVSTIVKSARKHTGYIHNWRTVSDEYARFFMASVESELDRQQAKQKGYRTFRIVHDASETLAGEIICPSESKGITCLECGLCGGYSRSAKDIAITVHGKGKKNLKKDV